MWFINKGKPVKIRVGNHKEGFSWITMRRGEKMELQEEIGESHRLEKLNVTKSNIGKTEVETKQFDEYTADDEFFKELTKIKGVGPKTAKDVVVWGTKEKLIDAINMKASLPFRDDIVDLLKEKYARKK